MVFLSALHGVTDATGIATVGLRVGQHIRVFHERYNSIAADLVFPFSGRSWWINLIAH